MKKFWMISMLTAAVLFAVSCGGGDNKDDNGADTGDIAADTGDTDADTSDTNADTGSVEPGCGNGVVESGEACDSNAMDCKSIDSSYTGGFATCKSDCSGWDTSKCPTGNNGGGDGGNDDGKYDCKGYADCLNTCSDDSCRQQCYSNTSSKGVNDYNNLYYCAKDNGCLSIADDAAYTECITGNCHDEIVACGMQGGSGTDADTRYNPSYGHLTLNFAVDQIATPSDQEAQKEQGSDNTFGRVDAQFAFGSYGNNASSKIIPVDTDKILSSAGYRKDDNPAFEGVSISQTFAVQTGADGQGNPQYAMSNPAVVLKIDKTAFMVGQIDVSPFNNPKALIQVLHMNWDTSEVVCVHAYGEGTLNITNATGDIANHGSIAFTGEVDLYNMRNYKGYSYDQNNDACDPVD